MSIRSKRTIFIAFLAIAAIWNCFCLTGIIPFAKWKFSLALTVVAALIILIPLFFPSLIKNDEKSRHYSELKHSEKVAAGVSISLCFACFITVLACVVYPL